MNPAVCGLEPSPQFRPAISMRRTSAWARHSRLMVRLTPRLVIGGIFPNHLQETAGARITQVFELLLQVFKGCFKAAVGTQVIRKTTVFPLQVQHPSRILDDRA